MTTKKLGDNLPQISVIIPSYNKALYIEETLKSILSQKYPKLELIIQDGGSIDGTVSIIEKYARKYPNIISWESKKDGGQVNAINIGLKKAKGEIVTYINADDLYKRTTFVKVGQFFQNNPQINWLTGYGDIIDQNGERISGWVTSYKNLLLRVNHMLPFLIVNYITQPSTFWRRSVHKKIGYLTGTRKYVLEYDFWLKLMKLQSPGLVKEELSSFRLSMDNISSTSSKELLADDLEVVKRYTNNLLILFFHYLHNLFRIGLIFVLKKL